MKMESIEMESIEMFIRTGVLLHYILSSSKQMKISSI